ncbi:hypothetical protein ABW19_dt0204632 [Dactylella cylindrospora]|nr:hypothetical protein ABW19_dt0204632 [Dactylella cylindrospora]
MATSLPPELWLNIASFLPFFTVQCDLKVVCKTFDILFSGQRFHRLPPKLWERIFENLSYLELRGIRRVSKDFRDLLRRTKSTRLLRVMFREPLDLSIDAIPCRTEIKLNPILNRIIIHPREGMVSTVRDGMIHWSFLLENQYVHKESVMLESITSPPVRALIIHPPWREPVRITQKGQDGISPAYMTVGATIAAVYSALTTMPPILWGHSRSISMRQILEEHSELDELRIFTDVENGKSIQRLGKFEILHTKLGPPGYELEIPRDIWEELEAQIQAGGSWDYADDDL